MRAYLKPRLKTIAQRVFGQRAARAVAIRIRYHLAQFERQVHMRLWWLLRFNSRQHGLSRPLVVSLTSYPPRFPTLAYTLKSLLSQSCRPDKLIIWVAFDDAEAARQSIGYFTKYGLEIRVCDNLKSYNKIIPALRQFPDCFIATADDDVYYSRHWLSELVVAYSGRPDEVVAHRVHEIRFHEDGMPMRYVDWRLECTDAGTSPFYFPTGCGGVLYPPGVFDKNVCDQDLFMKLCPHQDDIWLYWMVMMKGSSVRNIGIRNPVYNWPGSQVVNLSTQNIHTGENDRAIKLLIQQFGLPYRHGRPQ